MNKRLIIIGAGGHGRVIADIAIKMNDWSRIDFLDDDDSIKSALGLSVIGKIAEAFKFEAAEFFVAIGSNARREVLLQELLAKNLKVVSLVHPSAVIGCETDIGLGTAVMAGVVINCNSKIGIGCIINTSASLDHDNYIDDFSHISPGVVTAGNVSIGKQTWLGVGSIVSNNLSICGNCIIGAGAVVVKDITEPGTYIGVPAKRSNSSENVSSQKAISNNNYCQKQNE